MADAREMLAGAYRDFNARRIDAVLDRMQPDVEWANGMEGGYVYGREAVREYWTRQWAMIDPDVEPVEIRPLEIGQDEAGRFAVEVHQVVRDLEGKLLADRMVRHVYTVRDGLIERMEIQ